MRLEIHQLERRWEHLRVRHSGRHRRLLASLADSGQQTPIVVVSAEGQVDRYVVIDGYKRIAALEQLGRDTVEAVVWPMDEAAAIVLDRSLRLSEHETALEVGWLLTELERRFGYGLDELARRFDRSVSWVSRRLALVEVLPEAIQQQIREGKILAQVALKFLVPVARQSLGDCERMAAIFSTHHCDTREAGQLYIENAATPRPALPTRHNRYARRHPRLEIRASYFPAISWVHVGSPANSWFRHRVEYDSFQHCRCGIAENASSAGTGASVSNPRTKSGPGPLRRGLQADPGRL